MENFNDTWRDRHGLTASTYGLVIIHMLTVKIVAYNAYHQLPIEKQEEVEKLILKYQRFDPLKSKERSALVIEEICTILNPNHEISWLNNLLDGCCHYNSFYRDFGLNHIFSIIFLPILIGTVIYQKKYFVSIGGRFDEGFGEKNSLFQILELHREILKWHETEGQSGVNPIYRFGEDFVRKATVETGHSNDAMEYTLARYRDVQLNYGRA